MVLHVTRQLLIFYLYNTFLQIDLPKSLDFTRVLRDIILEIQKERGYEKWKKILLPAVC